MMQLISADHYAYFLDAVTEMHRLRYRVFKGKTRLGRPIQWRHDALQPAYLVQRARDNPAQGCVRLLPRPAPVVQVLPLAGHF